MKNKHFYILYLLFFITSASTFAQTKPSLKQLLWDKIGVDMSLIEKINNGQEEGYVSKVIDDTANGYLKIEETEEGYGCYYKHTVAAYKEADGNYTLLNTSWDGCAWKKTLSSNKDLVSVLPENFGIADFISKTDTTAILESSVLFYIDTEIPIKGTDTKLNLKFIPFGIKIDSINTALSIEGYKLINTYKHTYNGDLKQLIHSLSLSETLEHILSGKFEVITPADKKLVHNLIGERNQFKNDEMLSNVLKNLQEYYRVSKLVKYKSVILGWDRKAERFYIKEKIKNDSQNETFLEFLKQLPFLVAIC